ncbi:MAG: hypothetical protein II715_04665 [Clostridia bacterium]|nr:hypothetical protein [Clostridia bacterium]
MKKIAILLLAVLMLVSVAACATTPATPAESAAPSAAEPASEAEDPTAKDVLSFLNKDEIYFDVHLSEGLFDKTSVKVGDTVLVTSGKAAYTGSEAITFEGKSDKDTPVYLVIISLKAGERATSDYTAVDASDLPSMLSARVPIHKTGKDKILVVITDTKDGYDHNLDSALNDLLKLALA